MAGVNCAPVLVVSGGDIIPEINYMMIIMIIIMMIIILITIIITITIIIIII